MADIEQAAAGAEDEPGEFRPDGPRPAKIPRLILDQLALLPPLPSAARELPRRVLRDLVGNAAAYLYGLRAAVAVAALGWLLSAALVLGLWVVATPGGTDPDVPLRISGQLWLAAHHVLLHSPDGPFGLSPLGFTLLPVLGLYAAGRRTARRVPAYALRATAGAAVGYGLSACLIAAGSAGDGLSPTYTQVLLYPALITVFGHAAGAATAIRGLIPQVEARWLPAAGRGLAVALAVYLAAAGLLTACFIVAHADALYTTQRQIGGGFAGECGLFLVDLALVPNAALWVIAVFAGPGFALGVGTSVSVLSVVRGPLPGLPLLAATPGSQHPAAGWLLLFLVPAAAGICATVVIGRRTAGWPDRITATAATAAAAGLALAIAEMYAGGPVAFGPMSVVGSTAWLVGALASVQLLIGCGAGFAFWYAASVWSGRLRAVVARRNASAGPGGEPGPAEGAATLLLVPEPEPQLESALDDDGVAELVGEGLVLVVPEGPQVADVAAGSVEDVAEPASDGEAEAGVLSVALPDDPDVEDLLADGLPGGALPVELPELDAEDENDGEQDPDGLAAAARDGAVGVQRDGLDGGEVDAVADPGGEQDQSVDEGGADARSPAGEGA